jgi:hypothetical protein
MKMLLPSPTLNCINFLAKSRSFKLSLQLHEQSCGTLTCQKLLLFYNYSYTHATHKEPVLANKFQMCLNIAALFQQSSTLLSPNPPSFALALAVSLPDRKYLLSFCSNNLIIFLGRIKMLYQKTCRLYKSEEINCNLPANDKCLGNHESILADTFSMSSPQPSAKSFWI